MQQATDDEFRGAFEQPRRSPLIRLLVDWEADGTFDHPESDLSELVDDVDTERALVTDLPAETGLVDGYTIAKLTAQVKGRRRGSALTMAQTFSPLRTDSPLYGMATLGGPTLTFDLGFRAFTGQRIARQFTGPVNSIEPKSDGSVTIEALDPADRVRMPITLPFYGGWIRNRWRHGGAWDINSQWVLDYVWRQCGVFASPPPRPGTVISVTGHGGCVAEIGYTRPPEQGDWRALGYRTPGGAWIEGPFGMLAHRGRFRGGFGYTEHYAEEAYDPAAGNGIGMNAWVWCGDGAVTRATTDTVDTGRPVFEVYPRTGPANGNPREFVGLWVRGDGQMQVVIRNAADYKLYRFPVVGAPDWRFVGFHVYWKPAGGATIAFRVNGTTTYLDIAQGPAFAGGFLPQLQMNTWSFTHWSLINVWRLDQVHPAGPWPGETHTPQASIGIGVNHFTSLPDRAVVDAWELQTEVVAAEFGVIGHDEAGQGFFRGRLPQSGTVVKEIKADFDLLDLSMKSTVDSVRNIVGVKCQAGYMALEYQTIFELDDYERFVLAPGRNVLEIELAGTTLPDVHKLLAPYFPVDYRNFDVPHKFATTRVDNKQVATGCTAYTEQNSARTVRVVVNNGSGTTAWLAAEDGQGGLQPALRVGGWSLVKDPEAVATFRDQASITKYGSRTLPLDLTDWRQLPACLGDVARGLLGELSKPVPLLSDIPTVGDPRTQLADIVTLRDPRNLAPAITGRITKIKRRASKGEPLRDVLAVRPFASTWPV